MIPPDNIFLFVVFLIFSLSTAIQLFYYLYFYLAAGIYKHPDLQGSDAPVSVIVCARNEAENLKKFLPAILEQDYPDYEVIVVNDCSEDDSFNILGNFLAEYPHLKVSTVHKDPKFTHSKKFAQFIGIKAAKNDLLLFTDADCQPMSDKWLAMMTSHFDEKTDFVLGFGGYLKEKGLLNRYIRYDSMFIAMQYLGMAIRGIPYMGVGRNLAWRRSLFFRNKGFGSHSHLISGDDDLFVNKIATKENTSVEFRKGAHTRSVPSSGISEWFKQKKRHMTTARYYKSGNKFLLLIEPASRILFYASFILLLTDLYLWPYLAAGFGARFVIQVIVLSLAQRKLNEPGMLPFSLFFDIFSPFINGIVYISNFRNRPGTNLWK
ncbi:MAG: glycosyltransferase [Bacteroidales bacterium]|nr:glycosyltransferase [Bacteroidales bacterium]